MLTSALATERFAVRTATVADAEAIARVQTRSWRASYRGILPDTVLDYIDVGQRFASRRHILRDRSALHLVAYDATHQDVVGFCDAGSSRRPGRWAGEIYAIYLDHHAKRHGLGQRMFAQVTTWLKAQGMPSLVIWVLENNPHARRFYEAMGGRREGSLRSSVAGYPVVEVSYVWDRI